ncbi:hypothetical protein MUP35_04145 [Patescibacteria group bacterium]|nr:hypothetical protein [Patescibacteria group bacterium]
MLKIPYFKNRGKACALACYAMVAKYFFPGTTFSQIAKISQWEPGYVIWGFKFWHWIMEKGIKIDDYDLIDYEAWAKEGIEGLKKSVPKKFFEDYQKNSKDLAGLSKDIPKVINHKNFNYHRQKPTFKDLLKAFRQGAVCEVTLNSATLEGINDFWPHRVVILDIDDKNITFHDPGKKSRPARKESLELFKKAWLKDMSEPELCIYRKN